MRNRFIQGIFILLFLPAFLYTTAQEMVTRQYTTRQGLPVNQVYCAAQDANGFLWFGTDFGLARFDNIRFAQYYKKEGLINKAVIAVTATGADSLVFISYPDALQSINTSTGKVNTLVRDLYAATGFKPQHIEQVNGRFFIYQRDTDQFAIVNNKNELQKINITELTGQTGLLINKIIPAPGKSGYILCTGKGAFLVEENKAVAITGSFPVYGGIYTRNQQLVLAGEQKILWPNDAPAKNIPLPTGFRVLDMAETHNGNILLSSSGKGVLQLRENTLTDISEKLAVQNKTVNRFFSDADRNLWLCTDGAGIILNKKTIFSAITAPANTQQNNIEFLHPVANGILAGTANGLSLLTPNEQFTPIVLPGTQQHVYRLFNAGIMGTGVSMRGANTGGKPYWVQNSAAGPLLLSQTFFSAVINNEVWVFDEGRKTILVYAENKPGPVRTINLSFSNCRKVYTAAQHENQVWLGTDKGIVLLNGNITKHKDSLLQQPLEQVFKFLVAKNGILWIATDAGLYYYQNKTFFKLPDSKENTGNYCRDVIEDRNGNIWAATWDGIFMYNGLRIKKFHVPDGLISGTVNSIAFNHNETKLYAGTNNGLSVLALADTGASFQKRAFITGWLRGEKNTLLPEGTVLQPGRYNLLFSVSIPEYGNPDELNIQYRLNDGDWVLSKNPDVNIDDVRAGEHRIFVRAYLPGTDTAGPVSEFRFSIKKPFYKKTWFLLLLALLLQGLIFWLFSIAGRKRRQAATRKQQQLLELATLRQKAFTTLINPHFIFNALNSIQHYINKQDRQAANRYLSDFASLIRRNFDAAQQAFIPLDEELENIRLYLQLEKMRFPGKFEYELFVADEVDTEELFIPSMILQPFLENAVLHGLAPRTETGLLTVSLTRKGDALSVLIKDNGIGIEKSRAAQKGSKHKSRGMQLIKEKLDVLGRFGNAPILFNIQEAYPQTSYPGVQVSIIIPDSVYEQFPREAATHW